MWGVRILIRSLKQFQQKHTIGDTAVHSFITFNPLLNVQVKTWDNHKICNSILALSICVSVLADDDDDTRYNHKNNNNNNGDDEDINTHTDADRRTNHFHSQCYRFFETNRRRQALIKLSMRQKI